MAALEDELSRLLRDAYPGEDRVLVFGEGSPRSRIMLIGEAPGEQETLARRPFVGKAGKNLDEFLALAGIDRKGLYVTNTVKFRPVRTSPAGRTVNRTPTREEVALCLPYLLREIGDIGPQLIVTLGNVPLRALVGGRDAIGAVHGSFLRFGDTPLYPMYHPASLIYNPSLRGAYRQDILQLAEWVAANINQTLT